ncbi:hypothetical protein [Cyclobacterium jeungdonense]|uniref:Glycosyltransferase RgtA/B/C/D-like domain-containing protein n=1 Tax=Cyclobacterium jeungdonense TaxID=708087 RepID=A0ABT8CG17_9BACT|nr:hypothetical protein [Cyclobacterium jeungdonense]MDN3690571.1 hypothetical protein [Cyclobacterium jeungdonense]
MTLKDFIFILLLISLVFLWIGKRSKNKGYSQRQRNFLYALWVYHLGMGYLFYRYLLHHGGDSLRYWNLQSIPIGESESWMAHWGVGTAFIQWVNFPFSHWLGFHFLSGTMGYATLSFFGFVPLMEWMGRRLQPLDSSLVIMGGFLLVFLPNVHFWTAGVGKEAFLWLGLVLVMTGTQNFPEKWGYLLLGLFLSLMVRPIQGLILTLSVAGILPFHPKLRNYRRLLIPLAGSLIVGILAYRWIQGSLEYGFHFRWIGDLLDWQHRYLNSFGGNSSLPMADYSMVEKLAAVFFRPYPWEVKGFWSLAASLENSLFFLIVAIGGLALLLGKVKRSVPFFYRIAFVYGILLSLLFAFALNNLGVIMRMKSVYTVFISCYFYECMVRYNSRLL